MSEREPLQNWKNDEEWDGTNDVFKSKVVLEIIIDLNVCHEDVEDVQLPADHDLKDEECQQCEEQESSSVILSLPQDSSEGVDQMSWSKQRRKTNFF